MIVSLKTYNQNKYQLNQLNKTVNAVLWEMATLLGNALLLILLKVVVHLF